MTLLGECKMMERKLKTTKTVNKRKNKRARDEMGSGVCMYVCVYVCHISNIYVR
uniref:Uncharacterized protein n=1 Tax=Octopus bimaculoides TaxID=37653 RepID=A0A0L8G3Y2_OCTBM